MNAQQISSLNLRVLQRHDPMISGIEDSTSHVVVYNFDEARQTWNKGRFEGTLFIVNVHGVRGVYHRMMILNRLSLENLSLDLRPEIEFQVTGDYVIFRDPSNDSVQGLWIFEEEDRSRLAHVLQQKCEYATQMDAQRVPDHPQSGVNLMDLLLGGNGVRDDYLQQAHSGIPNGTVPQQQQQQMQMQPLAVPIPPIKHFQILWSVLDTCIQPVHAPRTLTVPEFRARLARLIQEPSFIENLYDAYKTV